MNIPEVCYGLLEIEMLDPSQKNVVPIIIKRGEIGYYRTDWVWGKEFAREAMDRKNEALGVDKETAAKMMGWSMFGWPEEKEAA